MKEKSRIITEKHIKLSMQSDEEQNTVRSVQAVDCKTKEKIRKLCKKKYPDGHLSEQADNIEPDKSGDSAKKKGSHSLTELHHFQNNHK